MLVRVASRRSKAWKSPCPTEVPAPERSNWHRRTFLCCSARSGSTNSKVCSTWDAPEIGVATKVTPKSVEALSIWSLVGHGNIWHPIRPHLAGWQSSFEHLGFVRWLAGSELWHGLRDADGCRGCCFVQCLTCHMVSRKRTTFASSLPMVGRRDLRCNKAGSYQNRTPSKACCRFRKLSLHCSVPILSDCPIYI